MAGERKRLESWKQIGDFLGCSPRTAQRHAKDRNLPVHHLGGARGTRVFAFTDELKAWLESPYPTEEEAGAAGRPEREFVRSDHEEGAAASSRESSPTATPSGSPPPAESGGGPEPVPETSVPTLRPTAKEWASSLAQQMLLRDPDESEPALDLAVLPSWKSSRLPPAAAPDPERHSGLSPAQGDGSAALERQPDEPPAARTRFSPLRPWQLRVLLGFGLSLIVLTGVLVLRGWLASQSGARLAKVEEKGRILIALDAAGQELWRRQFPHSMEDTSRVFGFNRTRNLKQSSRAIDLDGDGEREVLAVTGMDGPGDIVPWVLYCLDSRGAIRWKYDPGESLTFRRERCDTNWTLCFDVVDLDNDKQREILVLSRNHRLFPAKITLLDLQGRPRGEFFNSGWIEDVSYVDLDGDGAMEILAGGCNNGYKRPCLFALHVDGIAGCSPQPDTPDYLCPGRPPGREMYYLLFPRDPVMQQLSPIGAVTNIPITPRQIIVPLPSGIENPPLVGSMEFLFDHQLRLERVEANSAYELLYGRLFRQGLLERPYSPVVAHELGPVLYWDGERFVPTPSMNRHWRGFEQERRAQQ